MAEKYCYFDLYRAARELLRRVDGEHSEFTAQQLVAAATDRTVTQLVADFPLTAFQRDIQRVNAWVGRRLQGEPLAYILGQWEFHGLKLQVNPEVLIPRDDTEAVCELAIHQTMQLPYQNPRVLDLCAGTGCIGLAIAQRVKDARVTLVDVSPGAVKVAKQNIQDNHLSGRVSVIQMDVRETPHRFLGKYDLIVSNPPYVTAEQMEHLDKSVKDYEPRIALYGGLDGLDFYRAIVKNYTAHLKPGGYLCFEFGMGQESEVCHILMKNGYELVKIARDTGERARAVIAQLRNREEETDGIEKTGI